MQILPELGKIAGIAGICVGIFLVLFQGLITKNIFPKMTPEHGYKTVRMFMVLSWSIAVIGIGTWAFFEYIKSKGINEPVQKEMPGQNTPVIEEQVQSDQPKTTNPAVKKPTQTTKNNVLKVENNHGNAVQNNNDGDVHQNFSINPAPAATESKNEKH